MIWEFEKLPEKKNVHSRTIVKFLENRGWECVDTKRRYYILTPPPEDRKNNPDFEFWIVREELEGSKSYWLDVSGVIESIGIIYDIDLADLHHLFSKTLDEIKKDKTLQAMMEGSKVPKLQVAGAQN